MGLQSRKRESAALAICYLCWLPCGFAARQPAKEGALGRRSLTKPHLSETMQPQW